MLFCIRMLFNCVELILKIFREVGNLEYNYGFILEEVKYIVKNG